MPKRWMALFLIAVASTGEIYTVTLPLEKLTDIRDAIVQNYSRDENRDHSHEDLNTRQPSVNVSIFASGGQFFGGYSSWDSRGFPT
jgi:hypothetical protein